MSKAVWLSLPLLISCGGKKGTFEAAPASVVSSSSVWLRNSFDTDPSTYIGRFVPAGLSDLDESNAMTLACSKHIKARFIDGGGVAWSENLNVSAQVGARLGIPLVANAQGSHAQSRTARAQYTMTGKLVAEIPDPDAFAACCKSQPDQCSDRYIGEFIQGTGAILHQSARSSQASGGGTHLPSGASGSAEASASAEWQRAAEFPNPVYFAFKVSPTPYVQGAVDTCSSWVDNPLVAEGGSYLVGHADNAKSEQDARSKALADASEQAFRLAGLSRSALMGGSIPQRAESWCVQPGMNDKGQPRYTARVLAFVAQTDLAAARAQAEALAAAAREEARLQAEREEARLAAEREAASRAPVQTVPANPPPVPVEVQPTAPRPVEPPPPPVPSAGGESLERIVRAVSAESFSSDKLNALRQAARGARLSCAEIARVLGLFGFSSDQLEALRVLRETVVDPQNWDVVVAAFSFSSDRDAARGMAP